MQWSSWSIQSSLGKIRGRSFIFAGSLRVNSQVVDDMKVLKGIACASRYTVVKNSLLMKVIPPLVSNT